ncbi:hypothetical protein G7046_g2880 [Stylonectria norvegica]|nr:hypothetical protein G7046_g2880 [Stylonectria norvegica]
MASLKFLLLAAFGSFGSTSAVPKPWEPQNKTYGCGEVSIFSTGLPANHPIVIAQGADPAVVSEEMHKDINKTLAAGYNFRVTLMGPEIGLDKLADRMPGHDWDGTHIGFGVRGSSFQNVTIRLQDIVQLFREKTPVQPIVFDYSPTSALEMIQRAWPISEDCTDSPGKDLGLETFCDICVS